MKLDLKHLIGTETKYFDSAKEPIKVGDKLKSIDDKEYTVKAYNKNGTIVYRAIRPGAIHLLSNKFTIIKDDIKKLDVFDQIDISLCFKDLINIKSLLDHSIKNAKKLKIENIHELKQTQLNIDIQLKKFEI